MQELEKILEEIRAIAIELKNEHWGDDERHLMGKGVEVMCVQAEQIIRKHMDNDGWIPVDERLPEGRTRVICQFDNGDIELLWQDWESDPKTLMYWTDFDFMAEKKVIAWRPLPDPYRPDKE